MPTYDPKATEAAFNNANAAIVAKGGTAVSGAGTGFAPQSPTASLKPVSVLSSQAGAETIGKDLTKLDKLTAPKATTPTPPPTTLTQQQKDSQNKQNNPFGYTSTGERIANPNTSANALTAEELINAGITDPVAAGLKFSPSLNVYYPDIGTPADTTGKLSQYATGSQAVTKANDTLSQEGDWVMSQMRAMIDKVDPTLAETLKGIATDYENRKIQLTDINNRNLQGMATTGYRYGTARYAQQTNDQLLSTEERAGAQKLSELAATTQSLVMQAKQAADSGKFEMLNKYMAELDKKREEQSKVAEELAKAKIAQDKLLRERQASVSRDSAIGDLLSQGITDPKQILDLMNFDKQGNLIGDTTSEDVNKAIKNLVQDDPNAKNIFDIQKAAAENKAPKDVLAAIASAKDGSAALQAAGEWLAKPESLPGGVVGEYMYYKKDAESRGITPVDFNTYQTIDANRKAKVAKAGATTYGDAGLTAAMQGTALKLSDDYEQRSKDFYAQRDAFNRISASASNPSPAGDLALIFNYMKMLDPGSTVREGEFANAQNAGSVPQQIQAQYNKVISGQRLAASQRTDFVSRAETLFNSAKKQQDVTVKEFTTRAAKYGVPADLVVRDTGASSSTGDVLIQSEPEAKTRVTQLGTTNPGERSRILQMRKDNISWIDIENYYKAKKAL